MSDNDAGLREIVVREIAWRDVFPWLIIFRCFGLSISLPLLALATIGVLITPLGWRCGELLFLRQDQLAADGHLAAFVQQQRSWPVTEPVPLSSSAAARPGRFVRSLAGSPQSPVAVFPRFVEPFRQLTNPRRSLTEFAYFLFGGLWTVLVWSLFGGVITRVAAMHLGREERIGLKDAVRDTVAKLGHFFAAPLSPLLGVSIVALPIALVGLIMWPGESIGNAGVVVGGVVWFFVLLGGLIIALLLLGLSFGWPLMWATISAEGTDAFDALSRAYAYTFQRPLHYLFYAIVAAVYGTLAWLLVSVFAEAVVELSYWAASLGAGRGRLAEIRFAVTGGGVNGAFWFGASLIGLLEGLVRAVAAGFSYSFFWCASTAIYLLLRRDVDQTEFDEVYLEEEEQFGLPPLKSDEAGVPEVTKEPAAESHGASDQKSEETGGDDNSPEE